MSHSSEAKNRKVECMAEELEQEAGIQMFWSIGISSGAEVTCTRGEGGT